MSKIKFSAHPDVLNSIPHPKPASKFIPSWYKSMGKEVQCPINELELVPTIKQCLPVRDLITSGYIIPAWSDMHFKRDSEGVIRYTTRLSPRLQEEYSMGIAGHDKLQVKGTPLEAFCDKEKIVKLHNPWLIKTPSNYSCLMMSPFYDTKEYTVLPGIVDTDNHIVNTNFPIVTTSNEVFIKKGDPIVQVIPFKRDSWTSEVDSYDLKEKHNSVMSILTEIKSIYTTKLWNRKYYR